MALIDANALMERFRIVAQSGGPVVYHVSDICGAIEDEANEESVVAVEVVRCRDCDVPHNRWTGCPRMNGTIMPEDGYCSFGERRVNDE